MPKLSVKTQLTFAFGTLAMLVLLVSLLTAVKEYIGYGNEQDKASVAEAAASYATQPAVIITISVIAAIAAAALGWRITRSLMSSPGAEPPEWSDAAQRVAEGDLSPVPAADSAPAGSALAAMGALGALGAMQEQLVAVMGQLRSSADGIATARAQIARGNLELWSRNENQVIDTMKAINESSKQVADIIGVIDGTALQTNILPPNAAVEAAHASEQDPGFAVVKSEFRSLAERCSQTAEQIKAIAMRRQTDMHGTRHSPTNPQQKV